MFSWLLTVAPGYGRMATRALAIVPAIAITALYGEGGTTQLLLFSQVVLSLQLSAAVIPLVLFPGDLTLMGCFANPRWARALGLVVAGRSPR